MPNHLLQIFIGMATFGLCLVSGQLWAGNIDVKTAKEDPDRKVLWYDCKNMKVEGKGWTNTESFYDRLPAKAKKMVPQLLWDLSKDTAGMCIRFTTDADVISVRWSTLLGGNAAYSLPHMPATGASGVDVYAKTKDGKWLFQANGCQTAATNTASFPAIPNQEHLLYLPLYNGVTSLEIGVPKGKTLSQSEAFSKKQPILFYGTSVTQGACASRPGMAWTAIVGRKLDMPLINLGFSGSGKMEIEMASLLAELDPSIYVIDCLENMTPEMLPERIEPFVKVLRAKHPNTPIVLDEDANRHNITPTVKGKILRSIYDKLVVQGIGHLYFLSGKDRIGDDAEATVDGIHFNDLGMMRNAQVVASFLLPILAERKMINRAGAGRDKTNGH